MTTTRTRALRIASGFELPLSLVTEATAIVATRGAGKSSASAVLVEEALPIGVQTVVMDRTGVYWGLRSNAKGDGPGLGTYVLGGPHGDVPLEAHAGQMIADLVVDSGHSFVLDLSDLSKSGAVAFAADFLERLYDRKARARTTMLLVMDEAHFYAPQAPRGGFKGNAARLMGAMEDIVGLGRSRGLGVVLTTQRTQALNKAILDLIETLIVMRMLSPRARDAVQDWIREKHEEDREGVIETLEKLPTGTAWVWSPLRGILTKIAVRRIRTFDSYATPEPGQAAVEPSVRKELDLAALGEQMRATAERAKENDPAELRKRIRELERAAQDREPSVPDRIEVEKLVEVERLVEVPVVDEEKLAQLVAMQRHMEAVGLGIGALVEEIRAAVRLPALPPPPAPEPERAPPRPNPRAAPSIRSNGDGSGLSGPEQRVLDAIAWYGILGYTQPSKQRVGFMAGYKVGKKGPGGTFGNVLGTLRAKGLIDYPMPGAVTLTTEGAPLARDLGIEASNEAVQEAVLERVSPTEQRVLRVLIERYPRPMSKQDLGAETGYTVGANVGGTFGNILGRLRNTLGVIDYPSPGTVVALDVLFPIRVG